MIWLRVENGVFVPSLPIERIAQTFPGVTHLPGQLRPRTLIEYVIDVSSYLRWCGLDSEHALSAQTLRAWRQWMVEQSQIGPYAINRRLSAVKRMVRASVISGHIGHDVGYQFQLVERVPLAALRERLRYRRPLTPEVVRKLCSVPSLRTIAGARDRALLHTLASSGARISEVVGLTVGDIKPWGEGWTVQVLGKGRYEYELAPLSQEAYKWIAYWLVKRREKGVDVPAIFTQFSGRYHWPLPEPLSRHAAYRRVKDHAKKVGLGHITCHDFRRFVATCLTERHDLRTAQLALRHRRIETTTGYVSDSLRPGLTENLY